MLKGKSCTHHILSSLDLQGTEALMTHLLTKVGKAEMDTSNKTQKNTNTHLFLNLLYTHLSMF